MKHSWLWESWLALLRLLAPNHSLLQGTGKLPTRHAGGPRGRKENAVLQQLACIGSHIFVTLLIHVMCLLTRGFWLHVRLHNCLLHCLPVCLNSTGCIVEGRETEVVSIELIRLQGDTRLYCQFLRQIHDCSLSVITNFCDQCSRGCLPDVNCGWSLTGAPTYEASNSPVQSGRHCTGSIVPGCNLSYVCLICAFVTIMYAKYLLFCTCTSLLA